LIAKLCDAAASGNVAEVKTFIEQGAPINGSDYDKRTPLHLAASENQVAVMEALAAAGALELNPHDRFGGTPLMDAIRQGHDEAAQWLQKRGVSMEKEQKSLSFSLCNAAASGRTIEIERLLRHGAVPGAAPRRHLPPPLTTIQFCFRCRLLRLRQAHAPSSRRCGGPPCGRADSR